jgi:hypothetical protein
MVVVGALGGLARRHCPWGLTPFSPTAAATLFVVKTFVSHDLFLLCTIEIGFCFFIKCFESL